MGNKIWKMVSPSFYIIGTIASVISVFILFFKDKDAAFFALILLCIALILFLISLLRVLNRFLEKQPQDHKCISTFIQYTCDDGDNVIVETYKLIQAKCSIMQEYNAGFKWTGEISPKISSDLQNFKRLKDSKNGYEYDYAILEFKKPVLYNETAIVHFKSIANDVRHISLPYVEIPIKFPIEYIQICISLGYKDASFNETAKISKRKITNSNEIQQNHKEYDSILFDQKHKQYLYRLINPQVGYSYRIGWKR